MFCSKCGKPLDDDSAFCKYCGTSITSDNTSSNLNTTASIPREKLAGSVLKCPNCGEIIDSFLTKCPLCGVEIHRNDVAGSAQNLVNQLQQLESQRPNQGLLKNFASRTILNMVSDIDNKKIDLIRNFPIPNSREDVIEFLFLAISNIDMSALFGGSVWRPAGTTQIELAKAWDSKSDQAYQKAKYLLFSDPEFSRVQAIYDQKEKDKRAASKRRKLGVFGLVCIYVGPFIVLFLVALLIHLLT